MLFWKACADSEITSLQARQKQNFNYAYGQFTHIKLSRRYWTFAGYQARFLLQASINYFVILNVTYLTSTTSILYTGIKIVKST